MTSIVAVVEVTAFLTAAVLFSMCLVSTLGTRTKPDSPLQQKSPRTKAGDATAPRDFAIGRTGASRFRRLRGAAT